MRHQYWDSRMLQDMPRCAAEYELAEARPAVATHDQHVTIVLADLVEQYVAWLSLCTGLDMVSNAGDPVTGERGAYLRTRQIACRLRLARFFDA